MDTIPKHLYHYTTIDSLAQIITNRTIRFSPLNRLDDLLEEITLDYDKVGQWFLVSCWTDDENESIPLWHMYSSEMKGVRIKLPVFPFVDKDFVSNDRALTKGAALFENDDELDFVFYFPKNKLYKVEYVDGPVEINILEKEMINDSLSYMYNDDKIGRYKNRVWEFQNEWRYKILLLSKEFEKLRNHKFNSDDEMKQWLKNVFSKEKGLLRYFDMELSQESLNSMEILMGPCCSDGEKIIIKSLLDSNNLKINIQESSLKIRKTKYFA